MNLISKIIPSFFVDKASCTRQFESDLSLHSLALLFPIKEGFFENLPSIVFKTLSVPLVGDSPPAGGALTHSQALALSKRARDVTAPSRCSEPLRSKVGGASKPSPCCAGWDRRGNSSLQLTVYSFLIFVVIC